MNFCRTDFLPKKEFTRETREFLFMPLDFIFRTKNKSTELDIIGIVETGHRCLVKVVNLEIFVDVLLTPAYLEFLDTGKTEGFTRVEELMQEELNSKKGFTIIEQLPGKGFSLPRKYARLFFAKKADRNSFVKDFNKIFTLANDDSSLENLIFRKTRINTCGWNKICNFEFYSSFCSSHYGYEPENPAKLSIQVVIQNMTFMTPCEGPEKDKSIICGWDLETYTPHKFGRIPMPKFEEDVIKMCSMSFRFYYSTEPLLWVLISAIPISEKKLQELNSKNVNIKVIITKNIPLAFSQVLSVMQPDFLTGFNDGFYDWPFIKARVEDNDEFLSLVSAIKLQHWEKGCYGPMSFSNIYNKPKTVKIDAETSIMIDGYSIPGCVVFDTAPLMRRREKTETEWSLNHFLKKHGLETKYDMSYTRMSKIFRLYEIYSAFKEEEIAGAIKNDDAQGDIAINHLNKKEISELLGDSAAVGFYCIKDAEAVLNLLHKLFIIQDIREMGNISFTHTKDGFYKADGIKVRNCLLAEAHLPKWGIWPIKYPLAFTVYTEFKVKSKTEAKEEKTKYPGGYVIRPLRGIHGKTKIINGKIVSDRPNSGLDFSSLYPSLIMAYNFSPEYYISDETEFKKNFSDLEVKTLYIKTYFKKDSEFTLEKFKREGWFIQHNSSPSFSSFSPCEKGCEKGSNEWTYENHGIFPTILRKLFAARKVVKGDMGVWQVILEKLTRDITYPFSHTFSHPFSQGEKEEKEEKEDELSIIIKILESKIEKIREVANTYQGHKKTLEEKKIYSYVQAIKFITEKWREYPSYNSLIEVANFKFNYYNTKQNAIKVFMNTFYGETGSQDSPFYIVTMSGGITKMGRRNLKAVKAYVEEQGFKVFYGDSVTGETPIIVKIEDEIKVITAAELYSYYSKNMRDSFERTYIETVNLKVWTEKGLTPVSNIMRHKTEKKIYRILTYSGYVEVTEDHSLLLSTGEEISPRDCAIGTKLMTYSQNYPSKNFAPIFAETQKEAANLIIKNGYNYKLAVLDYGYMIQPSDKICDGSIIDISVISETKSYVYDLTTESGHFQAGIGNIIVHNTDSLYITPPEEAFEDSDNKYLKGEINKETFYEEMVGITMNKMHEISEKVAVMLEKKIGNPFLKMEYEEVLFPFGFLGKKNYFGIKHMNSIDFSLCKSGVDPNKFTKELFSRGLPLRRRDGSLFVKSVLVEMIMEMCSIEETRSYEEIIYQKITQKLNEVANSFTASNNEFTEEELSIISKIVKNYSFREPRENSHTLQMSYRKRMIKYHYYEVLNKALIQLNKGDNYGYDILSKLRADYQNEPVLKKIIVRDFKMLVEYFENGLKLDEVNYTPIPGLEHLHFNIPNYGSRANLILLRKPPVYTERGTKDVLSKGYCLEEQWAICNPNYAAFITHLYKLDSIIIEEDLKLVPWFLAYFSELYGKLSRFLLYLPKYNDQIERECEALVIKDYEDKMKKTDISDITEFNNPKRRERELERIKKKQYKNAEIKVIKKIKLELENQFKHYFPEVKCNNAILKENFKIQQKKIEEFLERSEFTDIITKYVTEEKYDLQKVNNEIIKLFEGNYIPTFVLVDLPPYMKDRTHAQILLENKKKSFLSAVNNICVSLNSYNDLTGVINALNILNNKFKILIKEFILEREIKKYFSEIKIKTNCEQDDEFEKFLGNYKPPEKLIPIEDLEEK